MGQRDFQQWPEKFEAPAKSRRTDSVVAITRWKIGANQDEGSRFTVHVLANSPQERASMARLIFAAGHHAEVYSDVAEIVKHRPKSGLILVHESGENGAVITCNALSEIGHWLPVVGFGEVVDATRIVAGMRAGAVDFFVGEMSLATLNEKLQQCGREAAAVAEMRNRQAVSKSILLRLSDRESQVLDMMIMGLSNKEMAREMDISPRTVEIHRMKMMGKIGATSAAHAVRIKLETMFG